MWIFLLVFIHFVWACGPWDGMYFWSLPGRIKDGRMGSGGKGMEVLSWLVSCQMALCLLVLTDVWCWHSSWWGSTLPLLDTDKGLFSSSCFSPSASAFLGIYLLYMDSLSWNSIILPGPLGQKSKQFQANSRNLEYIWSTGKKACMAFALRSSGCTGSPHPGPLLAIRAHFSFLPDTGPLCSRNKNQGLPVFSLMFPFRKVVNVSPFSPKKTL